MGFHPANLGFRFILEILSLIGVFRLGLNLGDGGLAWVYGFGFTVAAMVLWATFRVPGDKSAKGDAPFAVTGKTRILIEVAVFGAGTYGWFVSGPRWLAWSYTVGVAIHFILSYDRLGWLLRVGADGSEVRT